MIGQIRGQLLAKDIQQALVDVGGVAYEVEVPLTTAAALGQPGSQVTLHTHLAARDDSQTLYGFASKEARDLFRALIKVSSIGPRLATAILSVMDPPALARAIEQGDLAALTSVPGIGKRMAERIAMELKGRLADFTAASPAPADSRQRLLADAEQALIALGYRPQEASRAIAQAEAQAEAANLETLIKLALAQLAQMQS